MALLTRHVDLNWFDLYDEWYIAKRERTKEAHRHDQYSELVGYILKSGNNEEKIAKRAAEVMLCTTRAASLELNVYQNAKNNGMTASFTHITDKSNSPIKP
jgi:hypothetical protein